MGLYMHIIILYMCGGECRKVGAGAGVRGTEQRLACFPANQKPPNDSQRSSCNIEQFGIQPGD